MGSKHMMIEIYVDKSNSCTYIDCNMMTEELIHNIEEYSDVSTVFERRVLTLFLRSRCLRICCPVIGEWR